MKSSQTILVLSLIAWPPFTSAEQPASPLLVVEDHGGSSALPYYEALIPHPETLPAPPTAATPQSFSEAPMLPARSLRLTPGHVVLRTHRIPGLRPLFLLGDDNRSRAWLNQRRDRLQQLGAVGLVVNVESLGALQALRALAPDLDLLPVSADDLAQRLNLSHYPVLITDTHIEQ
ncbi:integrating conjugative element protein [Lelliottia amnigena]|uniref:integrating conjugative element protein n=1 Tax=Lelliottia amnigena TaxID=61646 RepID=UPI004055CE32